MMFGGAGMMGGWMMAAYGAIGLLVFLAGTLAVVVLLRASRSARTATPTAADVLAQRYARGEIDDDEYLQRQSVLESSQTVRTARGLPGVS